MQRKNEIKRRLGRGKKGDPKPSGVIVYFRDGRYYETGLDRWITMQEIEQNEAKGLVGCRVMIPYNGRDPERYGLQA